MLKFSHLSLRRGARELLHDVSCVIPAGQRVGVTGANGVGKSSLFALIRDELHADGGDLSLPPGIVIAHVAQETAAVDRAAIEYVLDGDAELRHIEQQIAQADRCGDGERLAQCYEQLEHVDGYSAPSRAARLMHGLGFSTAQQQQPVNAFSGGWRMRLNLARALMCRSDLLLLDEPTNHLDLEAVVWLEEWLRGYPGTLLLISHDRDFLDRVVTHIAHIERGGLTLYRGNYSAFEVRRAEQLASRQAARERQQREMAHMQQFVARFRARASKARQAQSRIKALQRMEEIAPAHVDSPFDFHFSAPPTLPDPLLQLDEVRAGYGNTVILEQDRLTVGAGERIGLLGRNGAGKSTLVRLLAGEPLLLAGQRVAAQDLRVGYFAQHQLEQLDGEASALQHLQRLDRQASEQALRNFLGGFGFRDDMAVTPVAPFSGGEKARLVLALLVYRRPNLLLLDEPTNHLDLEMRHALTVALQDYAGALVVVSHDRHLLRTVADTLLLVADGRVAPFDGDVDDYRQWVVEQERERAQSDAAVAGATPGNRKQQRQQAAAQRRRLQPLRREVEKLEAQLEGFQARQQALHEQLSDRTLYEGHNREQLKALLAQQAELDSRLQAAEQAWVRASEELERRG